MGCPPHPSSRRRAAPAVDMPRASTRVIRMVVFLLIRAARGDGIARVPYQRASYRRRQRARTVSCRLSPRTARRLAARRSRGLRRGAACGSRQPARAWASRWTTASTRSTPTASSVHEDRAGVDRGRPASPWFEPVEDEAAQAAARQDRPDRRGRDDLERRRPEPADDDRRGERELDAAQDLALAQAHPASGLDEVAVDRPQAGVRVDEDRRDREERHRDEDRQEVEARATGVAEDGCKRQRQRQDHHEDCVRGHGPADVGEVDRDIRAASRCGRCTGPSGSAIDRRDEDRESRR